MGWLADVLRRNSELEWMFDLELFEDKSTKTHLKRMAIETCIGMIGRTISQSEFRVRENKKTVKDEMYYRFNVRPNLNMTASFFWQTVVRKLIYDNECLIIKSDSDDLLIADSFVKSEFAIFEDTFKEVVVRGYEFKRTFNMSEVIYLQYSNEKLSKLVDELFVDYGDLFGRLLEFQKRKNQIRATVDIESINGTNEEKQEKIQSYIDRVYKSIYEKAVAIIPQQKGLKYGEQQSTQGAGPTNSVDEINKLTDGFLSQVAKALGIPISLLKGDMADVEKQTKNYMLFCINPLLENINDELTAKFIKKEEYLAGKKLEIKSISYQSIFDLATSIDKLISSGAFTGNELRDEVGYEQSDDSNLDKHYITKNYTEMETAEGGDNE